MSSRATTTKATTASPSALCDEHQSTSNAHLTKANLVADKQCYRQTIAMDPEFAKAYCRLLGDLAQANPKENDAIAVLRHAIVIGPEFEIAYSTLIQLQLRAGDSKQAQEMVVQLQKSP